MALDISQIKSAAFPAIIAENKRAANNWFAAPALKALEKAGFVSREPLGDTIQVPIDYRSNPDTAVMTGDQDTASLVKTEVLTAADYSIAQMNVPVTWTSVSL